MSATDVILECRGLSRSYRRGSEELHALRGADLSVRAGELVALTGPSGSGKTTLLNLAACLERPDSGEVWLDGERVDQLGRQRHVELRRSKVGYVFQNFYLLPELQAWENVALPMMFSRRPDQRAQAMALLESVGLRDRATHLPSELSGGEMQRVAIARGLANDARLLLADEPTGKLDAASRANITAILADLAAQGRAVLMATHDLELAATAHRVITVRDGVLSRAA